MLGYLFLPLPDDLILESSFFKGNHVLIKQVIIKLQLFPILDILQLSRAKLKPIDILLHPPKVLLQENNRIRKRNETHSNSVVILLTVDHIVLLSLYFSREVAFFIITYPLSTKKTIVEVLFTKENSAMEAFHL